VEHLDIHFLNVGHGDCTFIDHPSGNLTMIDCNNSGDLPDSDIKALAVHLKIEFEDFWRRRVFGLPSRGERFLKLLTNPLEYYRNNFDGRVIHRYVQTHPDMDHMSGLWRLFWLEQIPLRHFWDTKNNRSFNESDFSNPRFEWNDWLTYRQLSAERLPNNGAVSTVFCHAGESGAEAGDGIIVLSPTAKLVQECNAAGRWNDVSYVLRIEYAGRVVILPGDAEKDAWESILAISDKGVMKCDVLKAAHHGRSSGYEQRSVKAMSPSIVICSVGEDPATDASAKYSAAGATVFSTRFDGSMRLRIWKSGKLELRSHRGMVLKTLPRLKSWADLHWY
jgi:beta-lactamase superfamily II metal-dependent hydrolase